LWAGNFGSNQNKEKTMATYETEKDVIQVGKNLRPGQVLPGVLDLTKIVREEGRLAESVLSFLAQAQMNPTLADFALGIQNILGLYGGPNTERNLGRVIAAIRYAPIVIKRSTAAMKALANADPDQPGYMRLIKTDYGPVVHTSICRSGGKSLSFFLNPRGSIGDSFLTSIFSFPMVTWALVDNAGDLSIGQFANGQWAQQVLDLQKAARNATVSSPDYAKALEVAELQVNE